MNAVKDPQAGEVICIVDALDECDDGSRKQLIDQLIQFYSSEGLTNDPSFRLKFLVTSRPYDDIESSFQRLSGGSAYVRFDGDEKCEQISREINLVIDLNVDEFAQELSTRGRT